MQIIAEIDVKRDLKKDIQRLRNCCFPDYSLDRSYYKQLPHYRAIEYENNQLICYMGLDYRVISVDGEPLKILGVIDFCVTPTYRGKGLASSMLMSLSSYAESRDVDFIILMADNPRIYIRNGFKSVDSYNSWLKVDEHKNYGVAVEYIDDLYVKQVSSKIWPAGHVDWLGYMF